MDSYRKSDRLPDGPASPCDICLPMVLARAYDEAGKADSAIANYERALAPNSAERANYDPIILAPYSYRLGVLNEQKGDAGKARKYYQDFVNLWSHADPELQPRVAEARARLARLGGAEGVKPQQ